MPVGTGEFDLAIGAPLTREQVCQLFAPHAPVLDGDDFWELADLDRFPVICADLSPAPFGTVLSGLVRPGLDDADLLALARAVSTDAGQPVLIEDVTFVGDCPDHLLLVHPDGALTHAIGAEQHCRIVELAPALVHEPVPGAIRVRLRRGCGLAH